MCGSCGWFLADFLRARRRALGARGFRSAQAKLKKTDISHCKARFLDEAVTHSASACKSLLIVGRWRLVAFQNIT